jgi:ABC-type glycerol-3-phosphate transport system substrate-binding protein
MRRLAIVFALALLAGCGGGDDNDDGSASGDTGKSETTKVEVIENSGQEGGFDPKAIYEAEAPGVVTVLSLFEAGGLDSLEQGGSGVGSGFVQRRG